jgi:undecaprenyl-diphosphatase
VIRLAPPGLRGPLGWAAASAVAFAIIAVIVSTGGLTAADTRGILALRAFASPTLTTVMLAASFIAHGRVAVPFALAVAVALFLLGRRAETLRYVVACVGGELLLIGLKELVHHHRPVGISPKLTDAGWYSFPSGHVMLAVIIFGLAAYLLTEHAGRFIRVAVLTGATIFVVLVALSRVYLGAHWPSDCVGAALAGCSWSLICVGVRRPGPPMAAGR